MESDRPMATIDPGTLCEETIIERITSLSRCVYGKAPGFVGTGTEANDIALNRWVERGLELMRLDAEHPPSRPEPPVLDCPTPSQRVPYFGATSADERDATIPPNPK